MLIITGIHVTTFRKMETLRTPVFAALVMALTMPMAVVTQVDPCVENTNLGNEKRSIASIFNRSLETPICDIYLDESVWYIFPARTGSEIVELPTAELPVPDLNRCGTVLPIYIPSRAVESYHAEAIRLSPATVQAPVCSDGLSECLWKQLITIRYCNDMEPTKRFFVYNLKKPDGCDSAYCVGTEMPCDPGTIWNDNIKECTNVYPVMTFPTISKPMATNKETILACPGNDAQKFFFYCEIGYEETNDGAHFDVEILFDNVVAQGVLLHTTSANPFVEIDESLLKGNLGKALSCRVTAYWDRPDAVRSPTLMSDNDYWAGIRGPGTYFVDLDQADGTNTYSIDIVATVPVTCWHCSLARDSICDFCTNPCSYTFNLGELKEGNSVRTNCQIELSNENGENIVGEFSEFVAGKLKFELDNTPTNLNGKQYFITFTPFNNLALFGKSELWNNYTIPSIIVDIKQKVGPPLQCKSISDPHYTTIDNLNPNNYQIGDFILAKVDDKENNMYMEIQTRLFACLAGDVSCNCAVVVREGNTILGVDGCDGAGTGMGSVKRTIRYLESRDENGVVIPDGSSIYRDPTGTKFQIFMASGLEVYFDFISYYANVIVKFPPKYNAGNIYGMCAWRPPWTNGNGAEFRVPPEESMFVDMNPVCMPWLNEPAIECACYGSPDDQSVKCSSDIPIGMTAEVSILYTNVACTLVPGAAKRRFSDTSIYFNDTSRADDSIPLNEAFYPIDGYDEDFGRDLTFDWPTPEGKTEQDADDHCRATLATSPVYLKCKERFNEEALVLQCKEDIQILDDYSLADQYVDVMQSTCVIDLIASSNATTRDELESDPLYSDVVDDLCPGQCNNQGICHLGICICSDGFAGPDCASDGNSPPVITAFEYDGLCDLSLKNCAKFRVAATNVFDSAGLSCMFDSYPLLTTSGRLYKKDLIVSRGEFVDAQIIICHLPKSKVGASTGYRVSISNDGLLYSTERDFIVYNPACLLQTANTWSQKDDTCYSDEFCYTSGQRKNAFDCMVCEPKNNWLDTTAWSTWSDCSRSCDLGLEGRNYGCAGLSFDSETQLCTVQNCPAKPEEEVEGIVMYVHEKDIKTLLGNTDLFFNVIAESVNSYCSDHLDECCIARPSSKQRAIKKSVTSLKQCTFASGFPSPYLSTYRTKVIATRLAADVAEQCITPNDQVTATKDDEIFVDRMVLYNAVTESIELIQDILGFQIPIVENPMPDRDVNARTR